MVEAKRDGKCITAPSNTQFVLTIGDCGVGKSTFNNAVLGEPKNKACDDTLGVTQDFQQHASICPEFKGVTFIDSPGLNDPNMALQNWVARFNNSMGQADAPKLSLIVLLIAYCSRPTQNQCVDLATLLSCVAELRAQNLTVVFNKCPQKFSVKKALEFFNTAVNSLDEKAKISFAGLAAEQILRVPDVDQKEDDINQEEVETTIRPQVVEFISRRLKAIPDGDLIEQKSTSYSSIIANTGQEHRKSIQDNNEQLAIQAKSIEDLTAAIEKGEKLRIAAEELRINELKAADELRKNELKAAEDLRIKDKTDFTNQLNQQKAQNALEIAAQIKKQQQIDDDKREQDKKEFERKLAEEINKVELKRLQEVAAEAKKLQETLLKAQQQQIPNYVIDEIITDTDGNNSTYTGIILNGKFHGKGKQTWKNGSWYDGDWRDGKQHGQGKQTYENGNVYDGDWRDGRFHGQGRYTWSNGDEYYGNWKNCLQHGNGRKTYKDGFWKDGEWKEDIFQSGKVLVELWSGLYHGEVKNEARHGQGKHTYENGDVYDGEWKDGSRHGQGKQTYENGDVYDGDWRDGKQHGQGKRTDSDGLWKDGVWKKGVFQSGKVLAKWCTGLYHGEVKNGSRHGQGKHTYENGDVYDGEWKDESRHGEGLFIPGEVKKDFFGSGTHKDPPYRGIWSDCKLVKKL